MDAIFGMAGDDFVIVCADKTHCRSIVKMDVSVVGVWEGCREGGIDNSGRRQK